MSDIWGPFIGTSTGILTVLGTVYAAINHKKIVAKCCGKKFEFEIHVDEVKTKASTGTTASARVLPEESVNSVKQTDEYREKQRTYSAKSESLDTIQTENSELKTKFGNTGKSENSGHLKHPPGKKSDFQVPTFQQPHFSKYEYEDV